MNRILRRFALLVAITGVVWVAVLWHWETTRHDISAADLGLYLAALPLTVFGVLMGLRLAWRGAGARHEAALAAAATRFAAARDRAPAPRAEDEPPRGATTMLLAAHVAAFAGARPADLLAAAADPRLRPGLDRELRDADGIAVMGARIGDLQLDEVLVDLEPALHAVCARRPAGFAASVEDHVVRALAALAGPLAHAFRSLAPWASRLGAPDREAAAMPSRPDTAGSRPVLRWLMGWPAGWNDIEREAATEWARRRMARHSELPPDRVLVSPHAASSGEELWVHADRLLQTLAGEGGDDVLLVTASHSDLSDTAIAALERQQRLFSPTNRPNGLMPGEAAAALLLANAGWPADPDAAVPPPRLHRAAPSRRETSVEAAGRVSSECLQSCARRALAEARLEPAGVPAVVGDADQHTPRGAELYGATLALLPHLDAAEDLRLIGVASGHTGIASTLLVIATAAERARAGDTPCLALGLGDPFMRLALVVRPGDASTAR